jgi:YD repeat-containing protein
VVSAVLCYHQRVRALLVVVMVGLASTQVSAQSLLHRDQEASRPDLKSLTVTTFVTSSGARVESSREQRTYDKKGRITSVIYKRDGKTTARWDYTWSAGRLAKRTYREGSRFETRLFSYKLDAQRRVIEMTMRDPKATAGEHLTTSTTWDADGSRTERTSLHSTHGSRSGFDSAQYSASGRVDTRCGPESCEMFQYDARGNVERVRVQRKGAEDHWFRELRPTYDRSGRLATLTDGYKTSFRYDGHDRVSEEQIEDGTTKVYAYVPR